MDAETCAAQFEKQSKDETMKQTKQARRKSLDTESPFRYRHRMQKTDKEIIAAYYRSIAGAIKGGKKGGASKSKKKQAAARRNGKMMTAK